MKEDLGCNNDNNNQDFKASLQKLVLHDKGSVEVYPDQSARFNSDSIILLVQLPSLFTGNSMTIHGDTNVKKKIVQFDQETSKYSMIYSAYYSLCKPEMTPLESGYRLTLVYELKWHSSPTSYFFNSVPDSDKIIESMAFLLSQVR